MLYSLLMGLLIAWNLVLRFQFFYFSPLSWEPIFDEELFVRGATYLASGDFHPHHLYYPAVWFHVITFFYLIFGLDFSSPITGGLYLWGKVLTSVIGFGSVALIFMWGWTKSIKQRAIAALLVAFLGIFIGHSNTIQVDSPLTFFSTLAYLLFLSLSSESEHRRRQLLLWLTVSIGLAVATKYTGVYLYIPLAIAIWMFVPVRDVTNGQRYTSAVGFLVLGLLCGGVGAYMFFFKEPIHSALLRFTADGHIENIYFYLYDQTTVFLMITCVGLGVLSVISVKIKNFFLLKYVFNKRVVVLMIIPVIVLFATSPYLIPDWKEFFRAVIYQYRHVKSGTTFDVEMSDLSQVYGILPGAGAYFSQIIGEWGLPVFLCLILGFYAFPRRNPKGAIILLPYCVLTFLFYSNNLHTPHHYLLPLYPIFAIVASYGWLEIYERLVKYSVFKKYQTAITLLLFMLALYHPISSSTQYVLSSL